MFCYPPRSSNEWLWLLGDLALSLPGVFEPTLFEPSSIVKWPRMVLPSRFIKPIHPKTAIAPDEAAIKKVMAAGWWGQPKIHGHRAQIHIPSDGSSCFVYNRQGNIHKEKLSTVMQSELKRIFAPKTEWNVIDAEWMKPEGKIYVFDFLKHEGQILDDLTFAERYELIPKLYVSPHISTVPVFKTPERCLSYLSGDLPPFIEGLVFRASLSRGFADSTIVRCRRG